MTEEQRNFLLDYEIRGSWWAHLIWFKWGQDLAGTYFANRIVRKYIRCQKSIKQQEILKELKYELYQKHTKIS